MRKSICNINGSGVLFYIIINIIQYFSALFQCNC